MADQITVLIVEDEEVLRRGCERFLTAEGFRVLVAANGKEALALLSSQPVDVILCDLKMPVMGALEMMEETNRRHPGVPVIICTGHGTIADAVACMKKGAFDFVTKPFRAEELTRVIGRALERTGCRDLVERNG